MISPEQLRHISQRVEELGAEVQTLTPLRQEFPELHFSHCLEDEVGAARPIRELSGCNLYLVAGRGHCLGLTQDLETATGLLLAQV